MSSLWTPGGERPIRPPASGSGGTPGPAGTRSGAPEDLDPEERAALARRLEELRRQLVDTPAEVVIANHAYGMFELAALHLSEQPPRLDQARLAVDALGALVDALGGRLGEAETSLQDALAQIRLAFVQISRGAPAGNGPADDDGGS